MLEPRLSAVVAIGGYGSYTKKKKKKNPKCGNTGMTGPGECILSNEPRQSDCNIAR